MADEEIPVNELLVDVEDGIVVGLYHFLWLKDGKGRPCPEVNIPHTIIYANGRPLVWYFTSGKDRCIKRKHKSTISNPAINDAFAPPPKASTEGYGGEASLNNHSNNNAGSGGWGGLNSTAPAGTGGQKPGNDREALRQTAGPTGPGNGRPMDGSSTGTSLGPWPHHGVVARFQGSMTLPHNANSNSNSNHHNGRPGSPNRRKKGGITVELVDEAKEWFSRETLREVVPPGAVVVHGVAALHEGVLQKFVQPRGQHYFSLRATWSPHACVVERRTAKSKMNDPRVPLSERLAAFDSPVWLSEHTIITGSVLQGTVSHMCDNIAAHLADVSKGEVRVLRMVLYFAVDEANRIWLTHASTLRTQRPREEAVMAGLARGNSQRQHGSGGGAGPHHHHVIQPQHLLHLRALDVGGQGVEPGAGLDLPAPSPAFASARAPAGEGEGEDGGGGSGRFLCVLTGEMYPGSSRCDVTYKQLLQHWFSLASQLPNEGDRLRAMDTIPLAIRRANPSLTREWYLRVRSQPNFLYRTAPVCAEAAGQLTGMALEELQRTMAGRPGTTAAAVAAMSGVGLMQAASASGVQPLGRLVAARTAQGSVSQAGGFGAGLAGTGRPRQATALAAMLPPPPTQSQQARPPSRQHQSTAGGGKGPVMRSKSASASLAARLHSGSGGGFVDPLGSSQASRPRAHTAAPSRYGSSNSAAMAGHHGAGGPGRSAGQAHGQGQGLPSMLVPRDKGAGAGRPGSALLQAYGPTPEQAAEAAAAAAALPYEVLDEQAAERQQGEGTVGGLPPAFGSPAVAGGLSHSHTALGMNGAGSHTVAQAGSGGGGAGVGQGAADSSGPQAWANGAGTSPFRTAPVPASSGTSRRSAIMRMSTASDATEIGSNPSLSEPTSPNGTPLQASGGSGQAYHPHHHHGHTSGSGGSPGGGSSSVPATRMSPPRSGGLLTLQTIHEEGATAPPPTRAGDPRAGLGDADVYAPPTRGSGSHSVPRMRPPARGGSDRPPAPGASGPSRRQMPYPYSGSTAVAHRSLSESGELPAFGGGGGGSLNSTMASSVSVASRRSTSTQALLSNDDMRTLRELNEAYSAAERLTQQLLAQAHEILSDEGSRPPSTGTSPHRPPHGAGGAQRRPSNTMLSPPTSLPNSRPGSRHGPNGDGAGSAPAYTALVPPPSSINQAARPGSSSGPQPPSRQQSAGAASSGSGIGGGGGGGGVREAAGTGSSTSGGRPPGLPPAGQRPGSTNLGRSPLSQVSRTSSGRRPGSVGSHDGSGLDSGSHVVAQGSGLVRAPSASAHAMTEAVSLAGGLAHDVGVEEEEEVTDSGPAPAADLFTSAEAELLTEALQE